MSAHSWSSSNVSFLPPHLSSTNSSFSTGTPMCFQYSSTFLIFNSFAVTNILVLLPLCILILYLGLQRRWKRRSTASTSHSDIFTYHMVAIDIIGIFGCGSYCCGVLASVPLLMMLGLQFFQVTSNVEIFVHIITCVERHLAVVHPIVYQRLKNRGEVIIRNLTVASFWLLFLGFFCLNLLSNFSTFSTLFILVLSILVVCFCNFSVLRALTRPGPGEQAGQRVDQVKMRAFHTIMVIMGALLMRFGGHLLVVVIYSSELSEYLRCTVLVSGVWFCLPSSLVLPLLFLHRAGKLSCCKATMAQEKDKSTMSQIHSD